MYIVPCNIDSSGRPREERVITPLGSWTFFFLHVPRNRTDTEIRRGTLIHRFLGSFIIYIYTRV